MKKLSQKEIILKLLRSAPQNWFFSYQLLKANTPFGWLGSSGDRQARQLAEEGLIERRHQGKYAEYRAMKPKQTIVYKVEGREVARQTLFS